jgi:hypothetical protein
MNERAFSRTFPRTIDGLRVALAGVPPTTRVRLGEGVELTAETVGALMAFDQFLLPHRVEVLIPFPLEADDMIAVNRADWEGEI